MGDDNKEEEEEVKISEHGNKNIAELGKKYRFKAGKKQVEIARRGGLALKNNPNCSLGQKLRHLKEGGFTDKTKERLFELYKNKEFSSLDMLDFLEKLRRTSSDPKDKIAIYNAIKDTHKLLHGTKEHDVKVAAVVLHLTPEEKEEHIRRLTT